MINIAEITTLDTNNGPGFRTSIWIQGCFIHCPNCQNQQLWTFTGGTPLFKCSQQILTSLRSENCSGLSILGGEPLQEDKDEDLIKLCDSCHELYDKSIWLWTGLTWDVAKDHPLIKHVDVVIDGPYIHELRDTSLAFRGSSNQRIIDVKESLNSNKLVIKDY